MTKEEIVAALLDDMEMPYLQDWQARDIVDFVIKNYKPSLPSNLDEAAEEYAEDAAYGEPDRVFTASMLGFKDGAEWMAGQGETIEGYIAGTNEVAAILAFPRKEYNKGDKVVVQIRKK